MPNTEGLKDLIDFLNGKCGTSRIAGGGLLSTAGLIEELDALAKKFIGGKAASVISEAKKLAESKHKDNRYAAYYHKVMAKVKKDAKYIGMELARIERIVAGTSFSWLPAQAAAC